MYQITLWTWRSTFLQCGFDFPKTSFKRLIKGKMSKKTVTKCLCFLPISKLTAPITGNKFHHWTLKMQLIALMNDVFPEPELPTKRMVRSLCPSLLMTGSPKTKWKRISLKVANSTTSLSILRLDPSSETVETVAKYFVSGSRFSTRHDGWPSGSPHRAAPNVEFALRAKRYATLDNLHLMASIGALPYCGSPMRCHLKFSWRQQTSFFFLFQIVVLYCRFRVDNWTEFAAADAILRGNSNFKCRSNLEGDGQLMFARLLSSPSVTTAFRPMFHQKLTGGNLLVVLFRTKWPRKCFVPFEINPQSGGRIWWQSMNRPFRRWIDVDRWRGEVV